MTCVYCTNPLECDRCRTVYEPPDQAHYEALSRPEVPVVCTECESVLVCHWCRTPYDGRGGDDFGSDFQGY